MDSTGRSSICNNSASAPTSLSTSIGAPRLLKSAVRASPHSACFHDLINRIRDNNSSSSDSCSSRSAAATSVCPSHLPKPDLQHAVAPLQGQKGGGGGEKERDSFLGGAPSGNPPAHPPRAGAMSNHRRQPPQIADWMSGRLLTKPL